MISVTILTKNSQKYLTEVLTALRSFDEVVLYDNGSTDHTLAIAKEFSNVKIHRGPFEGFGPTHNRASNLAANDWILSIDSDEIVTHDMQHEVLNAKLDPGCVYTFPRHNYFNDKWIKWCGWYPDRQARLYHRKQTRFSNAHVHEAVITDHLQVVKMKGVIYHYSYDTIADFLNKMQSYSDLFAEQYKGKKHSSLLTSIGHGFFAFFKSYIIKLGFLGGREGYIISAYNGHTAYYKYLKLYFANQKQNTKK
jgi:glycosyltransferase involved in cell wall biosynthesis